MGCVLVRRDGGMCVGEEGWWVLATENSVMCFCRPAEIHLEV